ncbi:MAG: flagellar biosynthetic protein FliO, partial [Lysobacteraceae bacterium]
MSLLASTLLAVGKTAAPAGPQIGQHAAAAPSLFGAVLALLAVLALVIGLGWLLKRLPGSGFRPAEGMKVVASLSVGAKERVVVVEVNGQQLLLGVTAGGINTLHTLPEPLPPPAPVRVPDFKNLPNFA